MVKKFEIGFFLYDIYKQNTKLFTILEYKVKSSGIILTRFNTKNVAPYLVDSEWMVSRGQTLIFIENWKL